MADSWVNLLLLVYPIGSVYYTTNNSLSPDILFGGGTWSQIGEQTVSSKTIYLYERTA